jgi:hypothetical protein
MHDACVVHDACSSACRAWHTATSCVCLITPSRRQLIDTHYPLNNVGPLAVLSMFCASLGIFIYLRLHPLEQWGEITRHTAREPKLEV